MSPDFWIQAYATVGIVVLFQLLSTLIWASKALKKYVFSEDKKKENGNAR